MENEINKLKLEYQAIEAPDSLISNGANELWQRIDDASQPRPITYFAQIIMVVLIFFAMTGMLGIKLAQAKEGSVIYPMKVLAKKTLKNISETSGIKFNRINMIKIDSSNDDTNSNKSPIPTLIPSMSPSPTIKTNFRIKNQSIDESESEKEDNKNSDENENNSERKEVKGVNTSETSQKEFNLKKSEENSDGKNDNNQEKNNNSEENKDKN